MRLMVLVLTMLAGVPTLVLAEDCAAPCAGATVIFGLDDAWSVSTLPKAGKRNSLQPEINLESYLRATDYLKLVSTVTLEQVVYPGDGKNSSFENIGLYQSELYAELTHNSWSITAGKYTPVFSLAADEGDGVNGSDLAGNVDAAESLAAAASYDFDLAGQNYALTGTVFTLDRSFLAHSILTKRKAPKLNDGGAGNTNGVSSASLVLDGCIGAAPDDCHDDGIFGYRLGARYQKHGVQTEEQADDGILPADELAFIMAGQRNFKLADHTLRLMAEASYIANANSNPDDAVILTGIASYVADDMVFSTSLARQTNFLPGKNTTEHLAELAVQYSPESATNTKWSAEAAYTYSVDDEAQKEHLLSLQLKLELGGTYAFN